MNHVAGMEEQIVSERMRRKLEEVNAAAQAHLAPVQDHVNFTLQVSSLFLFIYYYHYYYYYYFVCNSRNFSCFYQMGMFQIIIFTSVMQASRLLGWYNYLFIYFNFWFRIYYALIPVYDWLSFIFFLSKITFFF